MADDGKRTKRHYLRRAERREQLLECALAAFVTDGYHGTQVSTIVDAAGVARGTFYTHFESKHDVFVALVDRMLGIFIDAAPPLREEPWTPQEDAHAALTATFEQILRTLHAHRRLCLLLLEEAVGIEQGVRERFDAHLDRWRTRVAEGLRSMIRGGVVRPDVDVPVVADLIVGMVVHVTRRRVLRDERPDFASLAAALASFQLDGTAA